MVHRTLIVCIVYPVSRVTLQEFKICTILNIRILQEQGVSLSSCISVIVSLISGDFIGGAAGL